MGAQTARWGSFGRVLSKTKDEKEPAGKTAHGFASETSCNGRADRSGLLGKAIAAEAAKEPPITPLINTVKELGLKPLASATITRKEAIGFYYDYCWHPLYADDLEAQRTANKMWLFSQA